MTGFSRAQPVAVDGPIGQSIMRNLIRPAAVELGIAEHIGWHTFRHTYSSLLRANGADIKVMQELLRHASSRVTLDTYTQARFTNAELKVMSFDCSVLQLRAVAEPKSPRCA